MAYEVTVVLRFSSAVDVPDDNEFETAFECDVVEYEVEEV